MNTHLASLPFARFVQEELSNEIQDIIRSNSIDKGRIMQSPERVKRKIQDMAASSEQLKPQINHNEAVKTQLMAKDNILRGLIQVKSLLSYQPVSHD